MRSICRRQWPDFGYFHAQCAFRTTPWGEVLRRETFGSKQPRPVSIVIANPAADDDADDDAVDDAVSLPPPAGRTATGDDPFAAIGTEHVGGNRPESDVDHDGGVAADSDGDGDGDGDGEGLPTHARAEGAIVSPDSNNLRTDVGDFSMVETAPTPPTVLCSVLLLF